MKYNSTEIGDIGEYYVQYQLARMKIPSVKTMPIFEYDILTLNNKRIEVKTATPLMVKSGKISKTGKRYYYGSWRFFNKITKSKNIGNERRIVKSVGRDRACDFFVFVCLNEQYLVDKCYVVPKKIIGTKTHIQIGRKGQGWLEPYNGKWGLITQ